MSPPPPTHKRPFRGGGAKPSKTIMHGIMVMLRLYGDCYYPVMSGLGMRAKTIISGHINFPSDKIRKIT